MSLELAALLACAALLAWAAKRRHQIGLLVAVGGYAAVTSWIIRHDLNLLLPALIIAIALSVTGLVVLMYRDVADSGDVGDEKTRRGIKSRAVS